ncbi:MAG: carboxypeptidase-like regulatory domain-containing protein, partial [Kangiellaceae bacterium]|nr:carboxypeptidase-like regulatory domain-containing protein [Kangiellaceae bacterium]
YKAENDNTLTWSTRISSFKIPSCTMGPTGMISGVVTDETSGDPIASATVSAGNISTVTNSNGEYSFVLPVGDYDLEVFRYGWVMAQQADVTVAEDDELTNNFALAAAAQVELTGTVTDSGNSNPLYAKVTASVPGDSIVAYTNPETGEYVLPVFEGTTINISTMAQIDGYQLNSQDVLPMADTSAPMALSFTLDEDGTCTAPGLQWVEPSFVQRFEGGVFPPTGWTVTEDAGDGVAWGSALAGRGNITGTEGDAALADSDAAGPGNDADTSLVSPVINVADISSTTLNFVANYRPLGDNADLDINVDGAGWTNVTALVSGTQQYSIDLTATLAGATSFQLRWRYYNANWAWYVSIDDVTFGEGTCVAAAGNLVASYVMDENTDQSLNGATVTVNGEAVTTSMSTDEDAALNDGFVYFFIPQDGEVSISANYYATKAVAVGEVALATPVYLQAGQIETASDSLATTLTQGRTGTESLDISNTGGVDANFNILLINGSPAVTYGPFEQSTRHMGPKDVNLHNAKKIRYYPDLSYIEKLAPGELVGVLDAPSGFGIARNRDTGEFWNGEITGLGAAADVARRYAADGTASTDTIDTSYGGAFAADMAFNQRTGMLWQVNVGGDNCVYELNTETLAQTGNTICPAFGISQRGLAYDPVSDTFFAGSWNDSMVHQFTTSGEILRSVNVGLPIAGLAYNPGTGHLFASLNSQSSDGSFDIVIMDAMTDTFVKVGGYDIQLDIDGDGDIDDIGTDFGQAGLDIDCNGALWMNEMNYNLALGIDSGETGVCDWKPSWVTATSAANTLEASASQSIELSFDGNLPVGTHEASLVILNDTPYGSNTVPVTLTINEPQYGTLEFQVTNIEVNEKDTATLTVERIGGADYAVSIDYATVDGSAVAGTDYTATSGTLEWADMDTAAKTITVATNELDLHKTFTVVLSNSAGGATSGSKVAASVTIVDIPAGSGSLGVSLLALFGLAGLARRKQLKAA